MRNAVSSRGDAEEHNGSFRTESREIARNGEEDSVFLSSDRRAANGLHYQASGLKDISGTQNGCFPPVLCNSLLAVEGTSLTLEQILAISGDALLIVGTDRHIYFASSAAEVLFDRSPGSMVGLTFRELFASDTCPLDSLIARIATDPTLIVEEQRCPVTGRWFEYRAQSLGGTGDVVRVLVLLRNIDDRRSAQERYERAVTAAQDGICEIDHIRDTAEYSQRWREMTECFDLPTDADEATRLAYWWKRVHPDDIVRLQEHRRGWRFGTDPFESIAFRLSFNDDQGQVYYRWFVERGRVERDANGNLLRTTGVLTDITAQKEVEILLAAEKARFERAMEAANEGLWETDLTVSTPDGEGITYRSPAWKKLVGIPDGDPPAEDSYFRRAFLEKLHPEDRERYIQVRNGCIFEGKPFPRMEYRLRQNDGTYRWFVLRGKTYCNSHGRPLRITGIIADIHDRKEAELALATAHARFERAAAATNDGIWEQDLVHNFHFRSERWKEMADIPASVPEDIPSLYDDPGSAFWQQRIHPDDWEALQASRRTYHQGAEPAPPLEFRLRNRAGEYRWVNERVLIERGQDGAVLRVVGVVADIHDRKTAELTLAARERFLAQVAHALPNVLYVYDRREDITLYVNDRLTDMLGYAPDDLNSLDTGGILSLIHPDDRASYQDQAARIDDLADNEFAIIEVRIRHKSGQYHYMRCRNVPFARDERGNIIQIVGIAEDITFLKFQEELSREVSNRLARAIDTSHDAIWELKINQDENYLYRSPQFWQLFGFDTVPEENLDPLTGRWPEFDGTDLWQARIHPDDYADLVRYRAKVLSSNHGTTETEYRILHNDGTYRWVLSRSRVERNENGGPVYLTGIISDIHARKVAEQQIRESEERFRALIQSVSDTVWRCRADGTLIEKMPEENPAPPPPPDFDIVMGWTEQVHPNERASVRDAFERLIIHGEPYNQVYRMLQADGHYRWRHARGIALRNPDGAIRELVGTISDITDRVEQERSLRESEARYRALVGSVHQGIWRADASGRIHFINSTLFQMLVGETGSSHSHQAIVSGWWEQVHPDDRAAFMQRWQHSLSAGEIFEQECRMAPLHASDTYGRFIFRAVPVCDEHDQIQEWIGVVQDITEQYEAEMRLRESEARLKEAQRITHSGHFRSELSDQSSADYWSDEMYRIFERDPKDGPPTEAEMAHYYSSEDLLRLQTAADRTRRNGMRRHMAELPIVTERGTRKWIQVHYRAERNAQDQVVAIYGAVVDITAFKALEESLRQAQQLARRIALAVPDLLYVYDLERGHTQYANRSIAQILGFGPDDPELLSFPNVWVGVGDNVNAFINSRLHPEDAGTYLAAVQHLRSAAEGEIVEATIRLRHKDGHWRTFFCRETVFTRDEITRTPGEILGVAQDITARVEAEDMRRESEEKYRSLVDLLSDWVWETDRSGCYVYISGQVTRRLGFRPEEMLGLPLSDFTPAEDRERLKVTLQGFAERKNAFTRLPVRVIGITGDPVYLEVSGVPLLSAEGEFLGYRGVAYDVTVRKQAETQLRSSEERVRRVIESSPDCMQILDMSGRLLSVNEAGRRILMVVDTQGVRGAYWPDFWDGEWRQVAEDAVTRARSGETRRFIGFTRSPRGEGRWWDVVITPLPDSLGRTEQLLVVSRDISAQKTLEQQKDQLLADAMQRAERDPLTGLFDHQAFHKRLQEEGKRAERDDQPFAVAVLDVDNFKYFNDAFGHLEGDAVLLHITHALRSTCRPTDTIGRLGGDEFAVILPGVTKQDATRLLESRLQANAFASRWQPRGYDAPIPLRISFGVAVYPDEATAPLAALSLADERLYRNKKEGQAGLLKHLRAELSQTMVGFPMLDALVTAVDSKDRYTRKHSEDVLIYAVMIGQALGLPEEELALLRPAALLHDVGKIGVSQRILRLPTSLTVEEFEAIKQHAPLGAALVEVLLGNSDGSRKNETDLPLAHVLSKHLPVSPDPREPVILEGEGVDGPKPRAVSPTQLRKLVAAVRHHHEAWNGTGYPDGLSGEDIPLLARVLAVADAFSALTTDRPYRRGANPDQAIDVLKSGAGNQWDPECVGAFVRVVETHHARALAALGALTDERSSRLEGHYPSENGRSGDEAARKS